VRLKNVGSSDRKKKRRENRKRRAEEKKAKGEITPQPTPVVIVAKEQAQMLNPKSGDEAVAKQNEKEIPHAASRSTGLQDWFAGALVLFTLAQAIAGYYQWEATNNQYCAMVKQLDLMQLEQRPWLNVIVNLEEPSPGHLKCDVGIHNNGNTPAITKSVTLFGIAVTPPLDPDKILAQYKKLGEPVLKANIVTPGTTMTLAHTEFVSEQLTAEMNSKVSVFVIFGSVKYADMTGEIRETQTCWVYDPKVGNLIQYEQHNYMH
jgi:hypothetical protein